MAETAEHVPFFFRSRTACKKRIKVLDLVTWCSPCEIKTTRDGISVNEIGLRIFLAQINLAEKINMNMDAIVDKNVKEEI